MNLKLEYASVDWLEVARIILTRHPESIYGYITGKEDRTAGYIYRNGKIVQHDARPNPWLYRTWGTDDRIRLRLTFAGGKVEEITCETLECDWKLGEYWPALARRIVQERRLGLKTVDWSDN